jgi:polysaccharide biosynthesis transport protein
LLKHYLILLLGPVLLFSVIYYQTKDEPKTYNSFTNIYTGFATGANLASIDDSKIDRLGTMTAFDNLIHLIKSRGAAEETGLHLFTYHMIMEKPIKEKISKESYDRLMVIVPSEVKALVVKNNFEKTYRAFQEYKKKDFDNFIYKLIVLNHPHYSYEKILSKLKVKRLFSSDMIEISYSSTDPGICQNTLEIITDVFIKQYSDIKLNQSDAILKYFEQQLNESQKKLDNAEDELLNFNKLNNIINYHEQSEHITIQKERFDAYYNELKMDNSASIAVLKILENKLTVRHQRELNSTEIIELRNKIANINIKIASKNYQAEFDSINNQRYLDEISDLHIQSFNLQEKLRQAINKAYFIDNTTDGITSRTVLNQWLEKVIEYESTRAKLFVGQEKIEEFNQLITEYAPKGATMKRLERKIDIAEREYLSILHSLNVAKLKQQNIELNSNLKVSEPPLFPLKSQPSKRKMLLLIGIILGFLIPAFIIIVLDYLDQNIKTAKRAEKLTGLKVASVFPKLTGIKKSINIDAIKKGSLDAITRRLIFNIVQNKSNNSRPNTNLFFSIQENEGKTTLLELIAEKLASVGYKIKLFSHEKIEPLENVECTTYQINNSFHGKEKIADFLDNENANENELNNYDFIFIEIPGILNHSYPINIFKSIKHAFLITRANRAWSNSDSNTLNDILEYIPENKPQILLNGVELDEMENIIGELPRKRTFLRKLIKNIIQFRFYSKSNITKKVKRGSPTAKIFFVSIPVIMFIFSTILKDNKNKVPADNLENNTKTNLAQTLVENEKEHAPTVFFLEIDTDIFSKPTNTFSNANIKKTFITENTNTSQNVQLNYISCGSFNNKNNAKTLYNLLKENNYTPTFLERENELTSVALGGFEKPGNAKKLLAQLQKTFPGTEAWIKKKQN